MLLCRRVVADYDEEMHILTANLVFFMSVIHLSVHVHDVVTDSATDALCYGCHRDDPDAKRNVVSL